MTVPLEASEKRGGDTLGFGFGLPLSSLFLQVRGGLSELQQRPGLASWGALLGAAPQVLVFSVLSTAGDMVVLRGGTLVWETKRVLSLCPLYL